MRCSEMMGEENNQVNHQDHSAFNTTKCLSEVLSDYNIHLSIIDQSLHYNYQEIESRKTKLLCISHRSYSKLCHFKISRKFHNG